MSEFGSDSGRDWGDAGKDVSEISSDKPKPTTTHLSPVDMQSIRALMLQGVSAVESKGAPRVDEDSIDTDSDHSAGAPAVEKPAQVWQQQVDHVSQMSEGIMSPEAVPWNKLAERVTAVLELPDAQVQKLLTLSRQERALLVRILTTENSAVYQGSVRLGLGSKKTIPEMLGIDSQDGLFGTETIDKLIDEVKRRSRLDAVTQDMVDAAKKLGLTKK